MADKNKNTKKKNISGNNTRFSNDYLILGDNSSCKKTTSKKRKSDFSDTYPLKRGFIGYFGYYLGMFLSRILIRLKAVGTENIPKDAPYIISPNHVTYVDGMWVASFLPKGHLKFLCSMTAKDLEDSHGTFGKLIVRVGRGIATDRSGNSVRSLIIAKKQLEQGNILLLHPEGTRSQDGQPGEFKNGAGYLSVKTKCPVLPVYISGGYEVFNRHMKWPKPFSAPFKRKTVTIYFGKCLYPEDYSDSKEITEALRNSICKLKEISESGTS